MKTTTDLLNELEINYDCESKRNYYEALIKFAMEKYAEQLKENCAVKFAEWINENFWIQSSNDLWYYKTDGNPSEGMNTIELFKLFNKNV